MLLLKLALRNLRRNLRRTLITSSAIVFGLTFLMFGTVMQDGMHRETVRSAVGFMAGHVVVQGKGFNAERDAAIVVDGVSAKRKALQAAVPDAQVIPRIFMGGLLTSPNGSMGVSITGVDPKAEAAISDLDDRIVDGEYVGDADTDIIIGKTLAESLAVEVGDKVVAMFQRDGILESQLFRVRGIFKTGAAEMDGFMTVVHLKAAQRLLGKEDAAHQLALIIDYERGLDAAVANAAEAMGAEATTLEILPWQKALPEVYDYIVLDDVSMWIFLLLLGFIVAIGILNTMLMSVLERVREFGTMLAVGMSPVQLAQVILLEGFLLGVFASTVGVVLGVIVTYPIVTDGLDYGALMGGVDSMDISGVPINLKVHGFYDWVKYPVFWAVSVALTTLSTVYPVWFTSRLTPMRAMRHR